MAKTRNLQITYSGISGGTPIQKTIANTGQGEFGFDTICANGTTTLAPVVILDSDSNVRCFAFLASGNCSIHCDLASGTDTTITLTANVPEIQTETAAGTIALLPAPVGNDTLTLKIHNAGSGTITFVGDLLVE